MASPALQHVWHPTEPGKVYTGRYKGGQVNYRCVDFGGLDMEHMASQVGLGDLPRPPLPSTPHSKDRRSELRGYRYYAGTICCR